MLFEKTDLVDAADTEPESPTFDTSAVHVVSNEQDKLVLLLERY